MGLPTVGRSRALDDEDVETGPRRPGASITGHGGHPRRLRHDGGPGHSGGCPADDRPAPTDQIHRAPDFPYAGQPVGRHPNRVKQKDGDAARFANGGGVRCPGGPGGRNNNRYCSVRIVQPGIFAGRQPATRFPNNDGNRDLHRPDFGRLAKSIVVASRTVTHAGNAEDVIQPAICRQPGEAGQSVDGPRYPSFRRRRGDPGRRSARPEPNRDRAAVAV